ncbi:hypothetical protein AALT52_05630 [Ligilactobacillus faecis]|uniref:Holin n=1 Tax=Ligilactobacillus faecis TaxID=762833 RepID=A0ABV4DPG7_9LACO
MKKPRRSKKSRTDLWVAWILFCVLATTTLGKLFLAWNFDLTDIELLISTLGALAVLLGTIRGDKDLIKAGKALEKKSIFKNKK